jgi:mitogen-activated protein kinase organizer 1
LVRFIEGNLSGATSSHDNTTLGSCGGDRTVFYWDVSTAQPIKRFTGHSARVNALAFNSESTVMASGESLSRYTPRDRP